MLLNNFLLSFRGLENLNALLVVPHLIVNLLFDGVLVPYIHRIEAWLLYYSLDYWIFTLSSFFKSVLQHLIALDCDEHLIFLKKV